MPPGAPPSTAVDNGGDRSCQFLGLRPYISSLVSFSVYLMSTWRLFLCYMYHIYHVYSVSYDMIHVAMEMRYMSGIYHVYSVRYDMIHVAKEMRYVEVIKSVSVTSVLCCTIQLMIYFCNQSKRIQDISQNVVQRSETLMPCLHIMSACAFASSLTLC